MAPKDADYLEIAHQRAIEKKTHVSFPQLKYPSLRDEGFRDYKQWLLGKSMDDGAEGLWRVHDSLYDLGQFVESHPGGGEWLELTKGTDITEAFECHHIAPIAEKLLPRFYVRDAKTPRNSPFTFKEDGFYRTLKNLVSEEIKKVPKDKLKCTNMITDGLFVALLISSALSCSTTNYWLVMGFSIVASVSLAWLVVAAHNYIHRKASWRMYYFNLSLWSYREFRVTHALSHHLYPNTLMDIEVSGFEPLIFWNPRKNMPFYANLAILLEFIIFPFLFITNWIRRMLVALLRDGLFTKHNGIYWHDLIGFSLPLWMYFASNANFYDVITIWLGILCGGSFVFFVIGANAAHHHPKIFKDGDQVSDVTLDWGMHELEAVMDRPNINDSHFKVMTFFGHHSLHHLFPTLDHALLEYLYPVFLKQCEKYKANFRQMSQLELFIGQLKMTLKTEPSLLSERCL
ncbi:cytochrome b5-related protein-like isoform X1 [Pararge aegeria]|uniref:cytochrome b5-related protein-like isoform X1 n=1 Tax=Pararge aegeria TaxID=116150 RepID=UPI0019D2224E|nr:cytochrome b5-related protein-like isoform X1 [Pararge aegeria]